MNRRTWVAGKPRKKPDLNIDAISEDLLQSVSDLYAEKDADGKHCSLNTMVAEIGELGYGGLNPIKVRKLLITAGVYESEIATQVLKFHKAGKAVDEIGRSLQLSRASVHSYLPYEKIIYKLTQVPDGDISVGAERQRLYKAIQQAVKQLRRRGQALLTLDFSDFCPDKAVFLEAEKIANIKERIVESLTKEYYLDCKVKEIEVRDMILTYKFLRTISEILYVASKKCIDEENQETLLQEISLVEIEYFSKELARIHDFDLDYAKKLIDRFIFHEKNNREDDIFAQPLLKVSRTQVVISQALMDQVNLDRVIERQFIRYKQDVSAVGVAFEEKFLRRLTQGYQQGIADLKLKEVPNFQVNTNKVKYEAFDGKEIEFDVVSVLGDHLVLTELKAIMTSYDLNDLEERKKNIKKAVEQLQRRKESVKYDWDKFKNALSIEVPDEPYDEEHIILVACTDSYDYTPLKKEDVFITDDSSYLKYFTNPYVDILITQQGKVEIKNVKTLWKYGKPKANEFKEYLMNPVSISPFTNTLKKEWIPLPVMDEKDYGIFLEEYVLTDDPIANAAKNVKKEGKATKKKKKIYPNDPCPCNSGKKYKYCCGK